MSAAYSQLWLTKRDLSWLCLALAELEDRFEKEGEKEEATEVRGLRDKIVLRLEDARAGR